MQFGHNRLEVLNLNCFEALPQGQFLGNWGVVTIVQLAY
jgi:hypothetical protein